MTCLRFSHITFKIANYEGLYPLLSETDFPDELIMNYWLNKFFAPIFHLFAP